MAKLGRLRLLRRGITRLAMADYETLGKAEDGFAFRLEMGELETRWESSWVEATLPDGREWQNCNFYAGAAIDSRDVIIYIEDGEVRIKKDANQQQQKGYENGY